MWGTVTVKNKFSREVLTMKTLKISLNSIDKVKIHAEGSLLDSILAIVEPYVIE